MNPADYPPIGTEVGLDGNAADFVDSRSELHAGACRFDEGLPVVRMIWDFF
jgi:hypothetical protein